jgi:2-polyprenyl-3-methyl-5-hydroxy-6-metoxy-1,4-benzoquinol methylase
MTLLPPPGDCTPTPAETEAGLAVARALRVAVFVVAYKEDERILETLQRIPPDLRAALAGIYVIDDRRGATAAAARQMEREFPGLKVYPTPFDVGYGGNLKLGFRYALEQRYDVVALLHGDGEYAPETLPRLLAPFADDRVQVVLGSRWRTPGAARAGGMPLYKRAGIRFLGALQNRLLGAHLSDWHCGYRAYRIAEIRALPFQHNTDGFAFDTEILIQVLARRSRIVEVAVPTYYGKEIRHLRGVGYAAQCLGSVARFLANRLHLVYHPKFDLERPGEGYAFKAAPTSLHQHIVKQSLAAGTRAVDLGAGSGGVSRSLHEHGVKVLAVDQFRPDAEFPFPYQQEELDGAFAASITARFGRADAVLALDVIEHLKEPERGLAQIHSLLEPGGRLFASTANVGYLPIRLSLLIGQFNYGKRGILDHTHTRLFTIRSFKRALVGEGFEIVRLRGFGPPIEDVIGSGFVLRALDRIAGALARVWPSLFSYQFLVEARRLDSLEDILARMVETRAQAAAESVGS